MLDPIKLAHNIMLARCLVLLAARTFNQLRWYAVSSLDNRDYCCAELAASSLAVAVTIAGTCSAYLWRDAQAELAWVTAQGGGLLA